MFLLLKTIVRLDMLNEELASDMGATIALDRARGMEQIEGKGK